MIFVEETVVGLIGFGLKGFVKSHFQVVNGAIKTTSLATHQPSATMQ